MEENKAWTPGLRKIKFRAWDTLKTKMAAEGFTEEYLAKIEAEAVSFASKTWDNDDSEIHHHITEAYLYDQVKYGYVSGVKKERERSDAENLKLREALIKGRDAAVETLSVWRNRDILPVDKPLWIRLNEEFIETVNNTL
jgi:hypothetical protein